MSAAIDVCEGCRRLRKRCDKDNCVLHPCLESLWPNSRQAQGNATVFLAKYFGRKRFFKLLEAVTSPQRAELFESLLQEACGRTVNPLGGATGLLRLNRWGECQAAVTTVLSGQSLRPTPGVAPSTPSTVINGDRAGELIRVDEPSRVAEAIKVDEPSTAAEPIRVDDPSSGAEPIKVDEPIMAEDANSGAELINVDELMKVAESITGEEPSKIEEPIKVEEPAAPS